jgi:hypothetical protein
VTRMPARSARDRLRVLVRAAAGLAMLSVSEHRCARLGYRDPGAVSVAARVLGARHLVEAVVLARSGTARTRGTFAVVDATHAASMIALAAVRPDQRRPALASAALTTGLLASLR